MDFLKQLEPNSLLLIPNNIKNKVLNYINDNKLLLDIKIISFNDIKSGLFYSYDNKAIQYLMNKYSMSYSLAKLYVDNTYYIIEDKYNNDKLDKLLNIKNELLDNNLLIKDELFIDLLQSKHKLYVYGFDYIKKYNQYLLKEVSKYIKVDDSIKKEYKTYNHKYYEAETIQDEVLYVAERIAEKIQEGIPLDKIYVAGVDETYMFTIRRIFKSMNIPYYIKNENILYDTAMAKYFFSLDLTNIEEALDKLKQEYNVEKNEHTNTIYNKIVSMINDYYFVDSYEEAKDMMIESAKTIKLPSTHMTKEITMTDITDNVFSDDEYVFLMNFNMGIYPSIKKDEDYINDSIKPADILETTDELNRINKETLIKVINNIKNLTITYKLLSLDTDYYPSILVDEDNKEKINISYSLYDNDINKLIFANHVDNLIKFNDKNEYLPILNNNYVLDEKYDNQFDGINSNVIKKTFSYSSISTYYECPFQFYCNDVLYLRESKQQRSAFIGSLFHGVLEVCLNDDTKDIDTEYDRYLKEHNEDIDSTECDLYFIEKVKDELKTIFSIIKRQYNHFEKPYKDVPEEEIIKTTSELNLNTKVEANIFGKVDKYILIGNDCVVIDYKTSDNYHVRKKYFKEGIDIQLPIYMYLLEEIKNYNVAGIYLQHILTSNNSKDQKESLDNKLKLDGLTLDDESVSNKFFDSNDRTNGPTRGYTYDEKEEIKKDMKSLIENCINNTYDANFQIAPVVIGSDINGCRYCRFRDICYKKNDQIVNKTINKEGDNNE